MQALLDQKGINALLKKIHTSGATMREHIQTLCFNAVGHSVAHGNTEPAKAIYEDLLNPKNDWVSVTRKQAIVTYLESFGKLQFDSGKSKFKYYDKATHCPAPHANMKKEWTEAYAEFISAIHWDKFTPERKVASIHTLEGDLTMLINKWVRKLAKKEEPAEKGKAVAVDTEGAELLEKIVADMESYKAMKAERAAQAKANADAIAAEKEQAKEAKGSKQAKAA